MPARLFTAVVKPVTICNGDHGQKTLLRFRFCHGNSLTKPIISHNSFLPRRGGDSSLDSAALFAEAASTLFFYEGDSCLLWS